MWPFFMVRDQRQCCYAHETKEAANRPPLLYLLSETKPYSIQRVIFLNF